VLVQSDQRLVQAQHVQQATGDAGVFAGHSVDQRQHLDSAQADVGQIADGGGHKIERAFGILLLAGDLLRRLEQHVGF